MRELQFSGNANGVNASRVLGWTENALLTGSLGLMMILPLAEVILRRVFGASISGVNSFTQHLTLLAGMLGAAVAAREDRLLSFSALESALSMRLRPPVHFFNHAVAALVALLLGASAAIFVHTEIPVGRIIAYGVPVSLFEASLPIAFIVIAVRLLMHSSSRTAPRLLAAALAAAPALLIVTGTVEGTPGALVPALALIGAAAVLGAPIFVVLGGVALLLFWTEGIPTSALSLDHYGLVTNPVLPTVPLFTLAGYLLAEGDASRRLLRLFQALVGRFRAGPAILTALLCAFFTSFTGGSGVTILALGGLLMPVCRPACR
jgi:TRAP-type C4-dicarboxylate transport system permease small subunit